MLEISIQSALVSSCVDDLVSAGLPERGIAENFFVTNDSNLILEVQAAIQEKSSTFVASDITFFKEILETLQKSKSSGTGIVKTTQLLSDAAQLDRKRFDLDVESLTHDSHLIQMYLGRLADRSVNNYHAKLAWASEREVKIQNVAETLVNTRVKFFDGEKNTAEILKLFEVYEKEIMSQTLQKDLTSVHVVPVLNWISPSLVTAKAQTLQSALSGLILNGSNRDNIGLVLMPQYTYHGGQLYKQEHMMMEKLHKNHVLTDTKFAIPLIARKDVRDKRPLLMDGRVISGIAGINAKSVWNNVRLQRTQMTSPTPQCPAGEMVCIDCLDEDTNPLSTDGQVKGAAKWCQLSLESNTEIIAALLDDLPTHHKTIIVWDLVPAAGGLATAMVDIMANHRHVYYAALGKDAAHITFLQQTCMQRVCVKVKQGEMNIPTITIPDSEPPDQVMQQNPVRPQLAVLEWENSSDAAALIPSALYNKWKDHEYFAAEFSKVKENLEQHDIHIAGLAKSKKVNKRALPDLLPTPIKKKPRLDAAVELPLPGKIKVEVSILDSGAAAGQIFIAITEDSRLFLVNKHTEAVVLPEYTVLGYFGKGSFVVAKGEEPLPQAAIPWTVTDDTQIVIYNGTGTTIRSIVIAKKKESPQEAHIWAHKITDIPTASSPFAMNVASVKQVGWVPKKSEKEPEDTIDNIGLHLPQMKWFNQLSSLTWNVKWSPMNKGLAPAKPAIVLSSELSIPPSSGVELREAEALVDGENTDA